MGTLQGFVHTLLGKVFGHSAVSLIVAAISAALIGWNAWRWRAADDGERGRTFDLMFAASVVVALVTGFHMFTHDLSPLLLAMLLVAAHFPGSNRPALRLTLGVALVLFWIPLLYFALVAWHCMYLWFLVLMAFMIGTLKLAQSPPAQTGFERV
jgi:ABC-type Na+ efflux pump permease subunit